MAVRIEIHHIGIAGGDTTAIIIRDGKTILKRVLIDAGGEEFGKSFDPLASYVATKFGTEKFDYIISSHYHTDHVSGFAECSIPFKNCIDAGGYTVHNTTFRPINQLGDPRYQAVVVQKYGAYVEDTLINKGAKRIIIPFLDPASYDDTGKIQDGKAGPHEIVLNADPKITLTCYAGVGMLADGTNALKDSTIARIRRRQEYEKKDTKAKIPDKTIDSQLRNVSPNDLSFAFVLQMGTFIYFTAGDISGDLSLTRYRNIEEPLIKYLKTLNPTPVGRVSVFKATHHGSNWNNFPAEDEVVVKWKVGDAEAEEDDDVGGKKAKFNPKTLDNNTIGLLEHLNPVTIVVPCNQPKGVPGNKFLGRLLSYATAKNVGLRPTALDRRNIAFVNRCSYWEGQNRQKATINDVNAIRTAATVWSNLGVDRDGDPTNNNPTSVVIFAPVLTPTEQKTYKAGTLRKTDSHTIFVSSEEIVETDRASYAFNPDAIKLKSIMDEKYDATIAAIGTAVAAKLTPYAGGGADDIEIATIGREYPIFTGYRDTKLVLNLPGLTNATATLVALFQRTYKRKKNIREINAETDGLSRNQLISLKTLIKDATARIPNKPAVKRPLMDQYQDPPKVRQVKRRKGADGDPV
jgi:hypothetical protein